MKTSREEERNRRFRASMTIRVKAALLTCSDTTARQRLARRESIA
jgi:hypothetical protein